MKKLSMLILVITIATASFAQCATMDITTVKKITTDEIVTSIKVYNNVEVILTDDSIDGIQVIGEKTEVDNIAVKIQDGILSIGSASADFVKDKVAVYIPAASLKSVYIHGASNISSLGLLNNESIDVTINGEGKSSIQSAGNISVNTIGDIVPEIAAL